MSKTEGWILSNSDGNASGRAKALPDFHNVLFLVSTLNPLKYEGD